MADTPKPDPCPWCGHADRLEVYRFMQPAASDRRVVRCLGCGASGPSGEDAWARDPKTRRRIKGIDAEASAIEAWNRREHPDAKRLDLVERHGLAVIPSSGVAPGFSVRDPDDPVAAGPTIRAAIDAAGEKLEEG